MSKEVLKPTQLHLNQTGYYINEDIVDNEDRISNAKWYEPVPFTVESLRLEGNEVVVNENITFEVDKSDLFADKEKALNYCYELNEKERQNNATIISKKRKELEELEKERERLKHQIEKGRKIDDFFNKWTEKAMSGETYKS